MQGASGDNARHNARSNSCHSTELSAAWNTGKRTGCTPNPYPARTAPGNIGDVFHLCSTFDGKNPDTPGINRTGPFVKSHADPSAPVR
jgi:hypothetical protein